MCLSTVDIVSSDDGQALYFHPALAVESNNTWLPSTTAAYPPSGGMQFFTRICRAVAYHPLVSTSSQCRDETKHRQPGPAEYYSRDSFPNGPGGRDLQTRGASMYPCGFRVVGLTTGYPRTDPRSRAHMRNHSKTYGE